ncbi:UDP-N-acetylglucosamine 2-epimerase [Azotosporobacter soli]|uniref:UDP-N-acetylglucosamine 2-epimerase n=1 Tax=Azotosporobacter soli TaxID=3055040 RepID=UPI0031FEFC5F
MSVLRKICVVTGTRAEYGLLYWLMKEIEADEELQLQLIVTGMHLSPEFGLTYQEIEKDGFLINEKIEMLLSSDTPVGIAKSIGLGVIGFAESLARLKPDVVVVLGDRYEILAAAQAAMIAKIPLAHIHGGEVTEGAIDESIRHAITKMAQLHFAAAEAYCKRILQLGENPKHVFNVGTPGLDNIMKLKLIDKAKLEKELDFTFGAINFLFTYHPATLEEITPEEQLKKILAALDCFPDARIIFTKANSDAAGRAVNQILEGYCAENPQRAKLFASLGQLRYLSTIAHVDAVMGNSSSGLLEVPFLKKPTINIGSRQNGRLKAASIVDCSEETANVVQAITKALSPEFKTIVDGAISPYGTGKASVMIKETLKRVDLKNIVMKKFYDLNQ